MPIWFQREELIQSEANGSGKRANASGTLPLAENCSRYLHRWSSSAYSIRVIGYFTGLSRTTTELHPVQPQSQALTIHFSGNCVDLVLAQIQSKHYRTVLICVVLVPSSKLNSHL